MRAAGIPTPTVFGHLDNGMVFDSGFREVGDLLELIKDDEVVIKERFGGQAGRSRGGPDASFFVIREGIVNEASNGKLDSLGAVLKATGSGHWIVQRLIKQHSQLALLNPTSVNTLRAHSFRSGREISVPTILVKAGKPGSFVDNVQWGGYYSELDVASGRLTGRFRHTSSLFDKSARDDIAQKLAGLRIPYLAEASALAMHAHELLEFVPGIGWDVAITDSGPIIIEGNDRWNLSTLQLFGGARDTLHQLYPDAFLVD
jgi:hypothetical protein